jgi:hypothetical protein
MDLKADRQHYQKRGGLGLMWLTSTRQWRVVLEVARHPESQFATASTGVNKCRERVDLKASEAVSRCDVCLTMLGSEMDGELVNEALLLNRLPWSLANLTQARM